MSSSGACKSESQRAKLHVAEADRRPGRGHPVARAVLAFATFASASICAWAQVAPNLGTTAAFTVLGRNSIPTIGTVTCTDTGPGIGIVGQVGTTFNAITNTGCAITGPIVAPVAAGVASDFDAAVANIDLQNPLCTGAIPIVTTTLTPGIYCSAAATTIGAGVTLTLQGNATDVWIFRVGTGGLGALTLTNAKSSSLSSSTRTRSTEDECVRRGPSPPSFTGASGCVSSAGDTASDIFMSAV